jgi:dTDP-4-dehydrorhamnose reductase
MTWLIIGASGQLGMSLMSVLTDRGIDCQGCNSGDVDITSDEITMEYISSISPTVIVNTAAWTDVDGAESNVEKARAVNADGALHVAAAAKSVGSRLVHISTDYVFSGDSDIPWGIGDSHSPISVYGQTKAAGENSVLNTYPTGSYIFRTAWLYSRWGKNFVKTIISLSTRDGESIKVVNDQFGQPTSALDLANQIVDSVCAHIPFGIYHATNSGQATWFEFATQILDLTGTPVERLIPVNSEQFKRAAKRPKFSVLNHDAWPVIGESGIQVPAMRDWRLALMSEMPEIIHQMEARQ